MNKLIFEWDNRKSTTNLRKHGVSFEDAQTVFFDENAIEFDDPVFFDNHANCDSNTYEDHEIKVSNFFKTGEIGKLIREKVRVFATGDMVCITAMLRYSSKPHPGIRTTYVLERARESWKIRHMHHSFDPNDIKSGA